MQEWLGCSRTTVYRLIRDHGLPTFTIGGLRRVDVDELHAWIEAQKGNKGSVYVGHGMTDGVADTTRELERS